MTHGTEPGEPITHVPHVPGQPLGWQGRVVAARGCPCAWCLQVGLINRQLARYGALTRDYERMYRRMKGALKKPAPQRGASGPGPAWLDKAFDADYPNLRCFLSDTTWDDGTDRTPGTLSVFTQDGTLKLCLNCRATKRVAFVTGSTFEQALSLLELGLDTDDLDWRNHKT